MVPINPVCGLQNCLSAHYNASIVSVLAQSNTAFVIPSSSQQPHSSLRDAASHDAGRVHAVVSNDVLLTVCDRHLTVITRSRTFRYAQPLHFEERALAAYSAHDDASIHIVIAGYDGVFFTRVYLNSCAFEPLRELCGTAAHRMICVDVNRTSVIAANLDGRVAVWQSYTTYCEASFIVQPSGSLPAGDRVTDLMFLEDHTFVVAWWSGAIVLYDQKGTVVWDMYNKPPITRNFSSRSGTFVTYNAPYIVACHGSGITTWIHAQTKCFVRKKLAKDVKGFCCAAGKLFLWDFKAGLNSFPSLSQSAFEQACQPITNKRSAPQSSQTSA